MTPKLAKQRMNDAVNIALGEGNSFLANEITANVMVGATMAIIFIVMLLCLLLNEFGVFTADINLMREAVIVAAIIEVPMTLINYKHVGTAKWLKWPLMIDLILVCATMAAALGHNVTLVMCFPIVVSTRYFDEKYTKNVAFLTAAIFFIANIICGYLGITNLNMVRLTTDATISVPLGTSLREAIVNSGYFDVNRYVKSLLLNDFIPRCVIFLSMSISCRYVAKRGKDMIEMQAENVKKTSRIETELDLATKIQTSMLPCIFPAFPEHDDIELHAVYHPAKEVGGDFYDYFVIDKTHVGLVIADVSGKGVGAALFMTISKTVLKNQLQLGISPSEALTNSNKQLCESDDAGLFVTCWAGVYDTETRELTFVNAGHNPPIILRKGSKPEFIKQKSGFVLAGLEGYEYSSETIKLNEGDEMFFYTDGVTEATNTNNELYGEQRLLTCLEKCSDELVNNQLAFLKADVDEFVGNREQFDDITIMGMRIRDNK